MLRLHRRGVVNGLTGPLLLLSSSLLASAQHPLSGDVQSLPHEPLPAEVRPAPAEHRAAEFVRLKRIAADKGTVPVIAQLAIPQYEALRADSLLAKRPDLMKRVDGRLSQAIQATAQTEIAKLIGVPHRVKRVYSSIPFMALDVSPRALEILEASAVVTGVEEDRLAEPMLDNTTGIVGATTAWAQGFDGTGWHVAILDTGVQVSHDMFVGKDIVQACFATGVSGTGDCPNGGTSDTTSADAARPYDSSYAGWDHGTHVAGIATGNDLSAQLFGVARGADLIAIQVFSRFTANGSCDPPGSNCVRTFSSDQIAGLDYVYSLRATYDIASTNMSLGGGSYSSQSTCDTVNAAIKTSIDNLRSVGIATAIASGNDSVCGAISGPGCVSSAIAVGAVTDSDSEASFSNFQDTLLDIYAPGVNVLSAWAGADNGFASFSGTSMATPHVAGTWAILRQAAPSDSVTDLLTLLQQTGASINGRCVSVPVQRRIQIDAVTELIGGSMRSCAVSEEVTAADPQVGAEFGYAVAVSGSAAAVGARREDCSAGLDCGAVYMHRWDGLAWNADGKVVASDPADTDRFGSAVTLSGDRLLVGAPLADVSSLVDSGAVYAYGYDGFTWGNEVKLTSLDFDAGDQFGITLAVDGDVAVIGATGEGGTGSAYVFRHNGTSWEEEQKLTPTGAAAGDAIGQSVAVSGDVIVLGANFVNCPAGADCGAAWVFRWIGSSWNEEQKLTAPDAFASDWFGFAVGVSADDILVSAPVDGCASGATCGSTHLFQWNGSTWAHGGKLTPFDLAAGDSFGSSLAMDGQTAIVGANSNDCFGANNCGSAYLLRVRDGVWVVDGKLPPPVEEASASFGHSTGLDSPFAIIGSRLRDANSLSNSGAAYVYSTMEDCNANRVSDTCDILEGTSPDSDTDGVPDECVCPPSSTPVADSIGKKNRYLTISAGDAGRSQAIRVRLTNLPGAYAAFNNRTMYVGLPQTICENAGQITPPGGGCGPAPGAPALTMTIAMLQCTPHFRDWSTSGKVNVWHQLLVPDGDYDIQVADETCLLNVEESFSVPLITRMSRWGDVVSDCTSLPCGAPNNSVEITDVVSILDKFKNAITAASKARSDIEPGVVDKIISISDVTFGLGAFTGKPYPFAPPGSFPCP